MKSLLALIILIMWGFNEEVRVVVFDSLLRSSTGGKIGREDARWCLLFPL